MSGEIAADLAAAAEEHLCGCEECSREFETFEGRFFQQYEPSGKALADAAKAPIPQPELDRFYAQLMARLTGECAKVGSSFPRYLHGDIQGPAAVEIESHLQACDRCSREFEVYESRMFSQYESAGKALAAARALTPPDSKLIGFWQRVKARIDAEKAVTARRSTWWLNAAALLVLAVSAGYLAVGREIRPVEPQGTAPAEPVAGAPLGPTIIPFQIPTAPAATGSSVRRYGIENRRPGDFDSSSSPRRAGGIDVIQPDGLHSVDEVRPLQDGDSVGF